MKCPHCKTEIDEHDANRCLDAWVAEGVMGWKPYFIISYNILYPPSRQASADEHPIIYPPFKPDKPYEFDSEHFYDSSQRPPHTQPIVPVYSTSIAAAWEVVEKFPKIYEVDVMNDGDGDWRCYINDWKEKEDWAIADTAPLAICRAALKATVLEGENEETEDA